MVSTDWKVFRYLGQEVMEARVDRREATYHLAITRIFPGMVGSGKLL